MPYNFVADSFQTKKLCSIRSSKKRFYTENDPFAFLNPPPPWGLRGNVRWSS